MAPEGGQDGKVEIAPNVRVPGDVLDFAYVRSSGPGGQNVNKRSTKCRLRVALSDLPLSGAQKRRLARAAGSRLTDDGEILLESDQERTQLQNRRAVMARLRELVLQSLAPPKKRIPTRPTKGSKRRRLEAKRQRGEKKRLRKNPKPGDWG